MNLRLIAFALAGLIAGIAAAVLVFQPASPDTPALAQQNATGKALIGGPFSLTDTTGRRVTEKDFAGKPMLVYFGFTHCPDICPAGLQVIAAALDKLGPNAKELTALFVTVDPERDTPEVLGPYVKSFRPDIVALTGSVADVQGVTKAYRVYAKKVVDEKTPADYSVDHSSYLYLMDRAGNYSKHFPHTVTVDDLARGLEQAL